MMSYNLFVYFWILLGVLIFGILLLITAPYGRHTKTGWGPLIDNKLGWFLMEFFLLVVLAYFLINGENQLSLTSWIIVSLITLHYLNRSILFPFRIRTKGKKMPLSIVVMGMTFNLVNGFLFGYYLGNIKIYSVMWLKTPQFILGLTLFFVGGFINWKADGTLINLRKRDETGYKIPHLGLFKFVSCPNLLGEVLEWLGFAILTWSVPGLAFFVWTFANLVPRAISHHKWYKIKFHDYPVDRKAIFPFLL